MDSYRIHKTEKPATLWVHPEGRIMARFFLHLNNERDSGHEEPIEVVNNPDPFIVVQCDMPDELRFYGKRAIVRVEHERLSTEESSDITVIPCELLMMDGTALTGSIREFLVPEHRRLFDYLNHRGEQFLRMYLDSQTVCLVNKTYIVRAVETEGTD